MKSIWHAVAPSLVLLVAGSVSGDVAAQGSFEIRWSTIDHGGGDRAAGGYQLEATVGQPDAPMSNDLSAGGFTLRSGYWTGSTASDSLFSDGFEASLP